MIPNVSDSTMHLFLGSHEDRNRERRAIEAIERAELGLPAVSQQSRQDRHKSQDAAMNKLATPFPRRVVQRKAVDDVLDIKIAQRKRVGPLPVDEEVAEENEIIAKQRAKLRVGGLLSSPGGLSASSADLLSNASFSMSDGDATSGTFLTAVGSGGNTSPRRAGSAGGRRSAGSGGSRGGNNNNNQQSVYAGDVLFRPGRIASNFESCDFWLYSRQKVTQRTLGTSVLQHPVVVGQSSDAESLKQLLLKSPIYEVIKRKVNHLLAQTIGRTRCGILFDLLSTRNIIVSGVPNVVGQIVYDYVHQQIRPEHGSLRFVFVGITDNSNLCAARDVFCQDRVLQGRNVAATKRSFDALDNIHIFAVPPPGGVEPLLGPAVDKTNGAGVTRSSPLGMRPWHAAMSKKPKHTLPDPLAPLVKSETVKVANENAEGDNSMARVAAAGDDDDDDGNGDFATRRLTCDDVRAAFDSRDWKFLPNTASKEGDCARRWEESELANLRSTITGPTVRLHKMTKRYNAECTMMKRCDLATVLSGVHASPLAMRSVRRNGGGGALTPSVGGRSSSKATPFGGGSSTASKKGRRSATPGLPPMKI